MKVKLITIENAIYLLILIFAAFIRFIGLGNIPLSENEAYVANQTLKFLSSQSFETVTPLTLSITTILFSLFGVSTFWARFFPALVGTILTILPLFWKEKLGKINVLIMVVIFSFDPLLVAASRKLDTPIIPITLFVLLILCIERKKWIAASIIMANFFLSGNFAIVIIFTSILYLAILFLRKNKLKKYTISFTYKQILVNLLIFIASYFLVASFFGRFPQGISNSIEYLFNCVHVSGNQKVSIVRFLISLPIYAPLTLVFGLMGIIYSIKKKHRIGIFFSFFSLIAIFTNLINPNRQVIDLILVTLPLSFLASIIIVYSIKVLKTQDISIILSIGLVLFGFFMWFNIASISKNNYSIESNQFLLQITIIVVILVLMILSIMMVAAGWSTQIAKQGAVWAFVILLSFYSLAIGWRGTHNKMITQAELWNSNFSTNQINLFNQALQEISEKSLGTDTGVSVNNSVKFQSITWETRDYLKNNSSLLDCLITNKDSNLEIFEEEYRGQSFYIQSSPDFHDLDFNEILNWVIFRDISFDQQEIILWVPQNLFE